MTLKSSMHCPVLFIALNDTLLLVEHNQLMSQLIQNLRIWGCKVHQQLD